MRKPCLSERGLAIPEYVIALTLLLVVFLVAIRTMQQAGEERATVSQASESNMIPCYAGGQLTNEECY